MANALVSRPGSASSAFGRVVLWREKIDTVTPSDWVVLSQCPTPWGAEVVPGAPSVTRDPLGGLEPTTCRDPGAPQKSGFETRAIHAGYEPDPTTGAVIPPIYATSTYKQDGVGGLRGGYEYSRTRQPDPHRARGRARGARGGRARVRVRLRPGRRGHRPACALTEPGDHVVIPDDAYGGTFRLFDKVEKPWGLDHSPAAGLRPRRGRGPRSARGRPGWSGSRRRPTRCSTSATSRPSPQIAHDAGALLVVDNTFASPYLQQPLTLGADVVVHSTTKYVGGHSDVVGGASWSATSTWPRRSPSTRTRWAPCRPVRLLPRPTAASRRWACGWTGTATTPSGSSSSSPATRGSPRCYYPGLARAPRPRGRGAADEALRRHGVVPGHAAASRRAARGLRRRPRCSRSASRSAASSR